MQGRFTQAGGCLFAAAIIGGFAYGVATGRAMQGVLIGTALGLAAAILFWLVDRSR